MHDGTSNTDEVLARIRGGEALLNQRGAETIGRNVIDALNRGDSGGRGPVVNEIVFQRRVVDRMVSRTIEGGGRTRNLIGRGRPPAGTVDPFGGI